MNLSQDLSKFLFISRLLAAIMTTLAILIARSYVIDMQGAPLHSLARAYVALPILIGIIQLPFSEKLAKKVAARRAAS